MLSSVLKSDEAVKVSINIMNAFVKMTKFISTNSLLFDRITNIKLKQLRIEKDTNKKFEEIFFYISSKTKLTNQDITKFNSQYGKLVLKFNDNFHDRFLILDKNVLYHIGVSIKDAGKKCFGITKIEDELILKNILSHINN